MSYQDFLSGRSKASIDGAKLLLDPAAEARQRRALAMFAQPPGVCYSAVTDARAGREAGIPAVAIRGVAHGSSIANDLV